MATRKRASNNAGTGERAAGALELGGGWEMSKKVKVPPVGSKVKMVNCLEAETHKGKVWTVVSEPWEVCGSTVVKLEGKIGGFDASCLEVVEEDNHE